VQTRGGPASQIRTSTKETSTRCITNDSDKSQSKAQNQLVMKGGDPRARLQVMQPLVMRLILGIAFVFIVIVAVRGLATSWTNFDQPRRTVNDFTGDYLSARAFVKGGNAYGQTKVLASHYLVDLKKVKLPFGDPLARNPHPPAYVMLLAPFAFFPYVVARNAWLIVMGFSIAFAMGLIVRATGATLWVAAMVALGSLVLPPVVLELRIGEANALVLLAVVVGWWQIKKGRPVWAGIALGIGSALKIFPLFLVIPLIRNHKLKTVVVQVATAAIVSLGCALAIGWRETSELVTKIMPSNTRYWLSAPHNLSLISIPFRWLTRSRWSPVSIDIPTLAFVLAIALVLFCIAAAATTRARLSGDLFWAAIPWMLLVSPLFWYEYAVLSLPLIYLILSNHVRARRLPPWFVLIGIGLLLIWTFAALPGSNSESSTALLTVFALPTYGLLILGLAEWRPGVRSGFQASNVDFSGSADPENQPLVSAT
jgi:Glycosyltransferase family 87